MTAGPCRTGPGVIVYPNHYSRIHRQGSPHGNSIRGSHRSYAHLRSRRAETRQAGGDPNMEFPDFDKTRDLDHHPAGRHLHHGHRHRAEPTPGEIPPGLRGLGVQPDGSDQPVRHVPLRLVPSPAVPLHPEPRLLHDRPPSAGDPDGPQAEVDPGRGDGTIPPPDRSVEEQGRPPAQSGRLQGRSRPGVRDSQRLPKRMGRYTFTRRRVFTPASARTPPMPASSSSSSGQSSGTSSGSNRT